MARPQTYNRQHVLEQCMLLFWKHGYRSTSIKDLTNATKLQPGSLYGVFKNKQYLFIEVLNVYFEKFHAEISIYLTNKQPPFMRIRQSFELILKQIQEDEDKKSCLLLNTLFEEHDEHSEIRAHVITLIEKLENEYVKVIQEAQQLGELKNGMRAELAAKQLINGLFGLHLYSRMNASEGELRQIMNNLLSEFVNAR